MSSPPGECPAALGYLPIAEWKRNSACIAAWPAHEHAWGEFLARAQAEHFADGGIYDRLFQAASGARAPR